MSGSQLIRPMCYLLGDIQKLVNDTRDPAHLLETGRRRPSVRRASFWLVHPPKNLLRPAMEAPARAGAHEGHATRVGGAEDAAADPRTDAGGGALREGNPM
jgi:hypothetical protein